MLFGNRSTRYEYFSENDWDVFEQIDINYRWINIQLSNFATLIFFLDDKKKIILILKIIQEGVKIVEKRIEELKSK